MAGVKWVGGFCWTVGVPWGMGPQCPLSLLQIYVLRTGGALP